MTVLIRLSLSIMKPLPFIITLVLFPLSSLSYGASSRATETVVATLILEAGGERDARAMGAVLEVIQNRADKGKAKGATLESVCLQRLQFSCWNGISVEEGIAKAKRHTKWTRAVQLVTSLVRTNYTNGATHYHASYMSPFPKWARSGQLTRTTRIGLHIFYK